MGSSPFLGRPRKKIKFMKKRTIESRQIHYDTHNGILVLDGMNKSFHHVLIVKQLKRIIWFSNK